MLDPVRCYMIISAEEKRHRKKGDMKCLDGKEGRGRPHCEDKVKEKLEEGEEECHADTCGEAGREQQVQSQDGSVPGMPRERRGGRCGRSGGSTGKSSGKNQNCLVPFKVIFVKAIESIKILWKLGARLKFSFD